MERVPDPNHSRPGTYGTGHAQLGGRRIRSFATCGAEFCTKVLRRDRCVSIHLKVNCQEGLAFCAFGVAQGACISSRRRAPAEEQGTRRGGGTPDKQTVSSDKCMTNRGAVLYTQQHQYCGGPYNTHIAYECLMHTVHSTCRLVKQQSEGAPKRNLPRGNGVQALTTNTASYSLRNV